MMQENTSLLVTPHKLGNKNKRNRTSLFNWNFIHRIFFFPLSISSFFIGVFRFAREFKNGKLYFLHMPRGELFL